MNEKRTLIGSVIITDSESTSPNTFNADIDLTFSSPFNMLEISIYGTETDIFTFWGNFSVDSSVEPTVPPSITTQYDIANASSVDIVQGTDSEVVTPDFAMSVNTAGNSTEKYYLRTNVTRVRFAAHHAGSAGGNTLNFRVTAWDVTN